MCVGVCANRDEAHQVQEEQQFHKLHHKQMQAEQDSAWAHSVPEWHEAELVGQNKPWTVPSQLLTAEEEVSLGIGESEEDVYALEPEHCRTSPKMCPSRC